MIDALKSLVNNLPASPGVYQMLDADKQVLYIGKARNLQKRVSSYLRSKGLSTRIQSLMRQVEDIGVTVTHTESEALLLENNLIKSLRPRYNILLRDDKSYPYIYLTGEHQYPRLSFYRGARKGKGRYFGPYPSTSAVRESLNFLQKVFPIRQCDDSFFKNRSRPCLQYQIKRCSAPCVGLINVDDYNKDVEHAVMFLEGKSQELIHDLGNEMEAASMQQEYERAAEIRDRISSLQRIQERQYITHGNTDADILAVTTQQQLACVYLIFIRGGRNLGGKTFFPQVSAGTVAETVLAAFLSQYYLGKPIPAHIYLNLDVADRDLLEAVFRQQAEKKVTISIMHRGAQARWIQMAEVNAADALRRRLASQSNMQKRYETLQEELLLESIPDRVECFDISHTAGEATVASCVVFDRNGPVKSDYRRFNIKDIQAGDDYAAMAQALTRRYRKMKEGEGRLPDLLLLDGGKGQLHRAEEVMEELQIEGVRLVAVAKGRERKPGLEQLFLSGDDQVTLLAPDSPALHLIQQIRDEAHRFAITGHRQRLGRRRITSRLEDIPGIGNKRRQALLRNFGGLQEVERAGVDDLARVPGISLDLARKIYHFFHEQDI